MSKISNSKRFTNYTNRSKTFQEGKSKHVRHEHLAPLMLFSAAARSHVHASAGCLPHEQVALAAQTQVSPSVRPQQVVGLVMFSKARPLDGKTCCAGE